jgi:hypothetical protein
LDGNTELEAAVQKTLTSELQILGVTDHYHELWNQLVAVQTHSGYIKAGAENYPIRKFIGVINTYSVYSLFAR